MRKNIMEYLMIKYLRTFPPISKNGNNAFGNFKRAWLCFCINVVGGRRTEEMFREIANKWLLTT
jgi:hypothetical protein